MHDFRAEMADIEQRARTKRLSIREVCREAGIAVSNWGRWKRGTSPTFSKWAKVENAVARLLPINAASIPSDVDSPSHAGGSSGDPNSEISESPQPVHGLLDHDVTPSPVGG